jgi:hypothetical protein
VNLKTYLLSAAVVGALFSAPLRAQWLDYPSPGIPRTPGGKPNLSAPAPRLPSGKLLEFVCEKNLDPEHLVGKQ